LRRLPGGGARPAGEGADRREPPAARARRKGGGARHRLTALDRNPPTRRRAMTLLIRPAQPDKGRHLLYMAKPALWTTWPLLPLIRRRPGADEPECGLLYDRLAAAATPGLTVYRCNLFLLPGTEPEFL